MADKYPTHACIGYTKDNSPEGYVLLQNFTEELTRGEMNALVHGVDQLIKNIVKHREVIAGMGENDGQ